MNWLLVAGTVFLIQALINSIWLPLCHSLVRPVILLSRIGTVEECDATVAK